MCMILKWTKEGTVILKSNKELYVTGLLSLPLLSVFCMLPFCLCTLYSMSLALSYVISQKGGQFCTIRLKKLTKTQD